MKKNFGKFVGALLLPCLMFSMLGGCKKKDDNTKTTNDNSSKTEVADANSTYMIGGIGPITGPAAIYGQAVQNAAQLAVDEINANGGVNGHQLAFKFEDDEHDAEKSVNAYNSLKDWGMKILCGTVTSKPCEAVAEETKQDNMFQITPSGSSETCIKYDNAFRICFSDPDLGHDSAVYMGEKGVAKKVAVIYDSSDVYSSGIYEAFDKECKNQGIEIVSAEAFTADNNTDFSVQLQKAKDAGAELVFLPIYYSQAALILKQADTMGYAPKFFGCDGLDGILSVENFDTKLAEGVMLITPFSADTPDDATQKFVDSYKKAYKEIPNQFAADAYDAIYTIKAAIEKSGVNPSDSISDICEGLKSAMTEISIDGLTGSITWDAKGVPTKDPKVVTITDGKYVLND